MKLKAFVTLALATIISLSETTSQATEDYGNSNEIDNKSEKKFLDISSEQREKLEKLKQNVSSELTNDYMSKDEYLLRFLYHTNFNFSSSRNLILNMLKWRKAERIDQLGKEQFPEFEEEYKIFLDGCDAQNRPVIYIPLGQWDLRSAVLAGIGPRLTRYMDKVLEESTAFLRAMNNIGVQIFQATMIVDLNGFDMKTHACPVCLKIYLHFFYTIQTNYPGLVEKIIFVNAPPIMNLIWDIHPDAFSPMMRAKSIVLTKRDKDWKQSLLEEIPASSLNSRLGGKKRTSLEFHYLTLGQELVPALDRVGAVHITNNCEKDVLMYETLIREINQVFENRKQNAINWEC